MKVAVKTIRGKSRLVDESTGRIAKTRNGNPVDGGGHTFRQKAERQAGHVNTASCGRKKV